MREREREREREKERDRKVPKDFAENKIIRSKREN